MLILIHIIINIESRVKRVCGRVQTVKSPLSGNEDKESGRVSRLPNPDSRLPAYPSSRAYSSSITLSSSFLNSGAGWRNAFPDGSALCPQAPRAVRPTLRALSRFCQRSPRGHRPRRDHRHVALWPAALVPGLRHVANPLCRRYGATGHVSACKYLRHSSCVHQRVSREEANETRSSTGRTYRRIFSPK